jgi:hypothetical protein
VRVVRRAHCAPTTADQHRASVSRALPAPPVRPSTRSTCSVDRARHCLPCSARWPPSPSRRSRPARLR